MQKNPHKAISFNSLIVSDLSAETLQTKMEWHDVFKVTKGKNLKRSILYPARLPFKLDREMKCYNQAKAKRIRHHQTNFLKNAKGAFLIIKK